MKARDRGAPSYLEYSKHPQNTLKASMFRILLVERQVELEHVDARLAQQPEIRRFGVLRNQLIELIGGNATGFGHARRLRLRLRGADVGIQAARRPGQHIGWNGPCIVRVFLVEFVHRRLHAIDQLLIGGAVIKSTGSGGIVAVVTGSGGTRLEILGPCEILANQLRTDDSIAFGDQAAVGLMRKDDLRDPVTASG